MLKRYLKTAITTTTYMSGAVFLFIWGAIRKLLELKDHGAIEARPARLIVITGCDTGLGLAMAKWAGDSGYMVLAGCLRGESEGAELLRRECNKNVYVQELNVTDKSSIAEFTQRSASIAEDNALELHALILNAAVCTPGEFFWLTEEQAHSQMDVNFWGAVNVTEAFQKQLLEHKSRVIVISSDCADYPLPSLAVYSASKAALQSWAIALRLELAKYGVTVTNFQPGSFPFQSRLFSSVTKQYELMKAKLEENQLAEFYGSLLERFFQHYLTTFDGKTDLAPFEDENLKNSLFALLETSQNKTPKYICENFGLSIFHMIISIFPTNMSDSLVLKALKTPKWDGATNHKRN